MSDNEGTTEVKRRGRPAKTVASEGVKDAKKRPASATKKDVAKETNGDVPAKRGRGRPAKVQKKAKTVAAPKGNSKGRGRTSKKDKKATTESEEDAESAEEEA